MSVGIDLHRGWRRLSPRVAAASVLGLLLVVMAACGGGDRVSSFSPQRLLVFGDEANVIAGSDGLLYTADAPPVAITTQAGAKYSVNARNLDAGGAPLATYNCSALAIWVQAVAARYGIGLAAVPPNATTATVAPDACNPYTTGPARGRIYAQVGARVATVATQVANHQISTGTGFSNTDLVTVMVGQRDILDAYALYPAQSEDAVVAIAEAAGRALGTQVNAIATAGGRVLIATIPNQGATPFAAAQNLIGGERGPLLTRMTQRFNAGLRAALLNDGRLIGLVQADEQLQFVINNPSVFGYASTSAVACSGLTAPSASAPFVPTNELLNCVAPTAATASAPATTGTLVTGASVSNYLWADHYRFNVDAHSRIGNLAITRAVNNPF